MTVLALTGGAGGAKLALGLYHCLPPEKLICLVNTADDFEYLGLNISPDLDSLMYALGNESNEVVGWGRRHESWQFKAAVEQYGVKPWFALGDRDLATHVLRTEALRKGTTLTEVTARLSRHLSVQCQVLPMTEMIVSTMIQTTLGELAFQDYFVLQKCEPIMTAIRFAGIQEAKPNPAVVAVLNKPLDIIILCPSNPYVSMAPILKLPGLIDAIKENGAPVIAVSPIVDGQALKGPAAKMMRESGVAVSAVAVAEHYVNHYPGLLSGFVLDSSDDEQLPAVKALGLKAASLPTIMLNLADRKALASQLLAHFSQHS